jgi:hypothetical protein
MDKLTHPMKPIRAPARRVRLGRIALEALRERAKVDPEMAAYLKQHGIASDEG